MASKLTNVLCVGANFAIATNELVRIASIDSAATSKWYFRG
ncbi:hypothetical protein [Lactococcus sp.]